MARETVAERNARFAKEREERHAQEALAYPALLMSLLERAGKHTQFELSVKNGFFKVTDRNDHYDNEYELSYSWTTDAQVVLENLTYTVERAEAAEAETRRRAEVYANAKKKLQELFTDEERELLDL